MTRVELTWLYADSSRHWWLPCENSRIRTDMAVAVLGSTRLSPTPNCISVDTADPKRNGTDAISFPSQSLQNTVRTIMIKSPFGCVVVLLAVQFIGGFGLATQHATPEFPTRPFNDRSALASVSIGSQVDISSIQGVEDSELTPTEEALKVETDTKMKRALDTETKTKLGVAGGAVTTTTANSESTPSNPPIFLQVTTSGSDPLGMNQVSGFYGPGAWSAWILTIIGAWWTLFRARSKRFDLNTWLFLFVLNWVAIDIFRGLHSMGQVSTTDRNHARKFDKHLGSYGAALNMLFWGCFHGLLQLATTYTFIYRGHASQRLRTLAIGLPLPLIALACSSGLFFLLPDSRLSKIPALYWKGMRQETHDFILTTASCTVLLVLPGILVLYRTKLLPGPFYRTLRYVVSFNQTKGKRFWIVVLVLSIFALYMSIFGIAVTDNEGWFWGMVPSFILMSPLLFLLSFPVLWLGTVLISATHYVLTGLGSHVSESCFFMPCSPQSMKDEDQIYALLAGIFAFVGLEVIPFFHAKLRKRWLEDRQFESQVEAGLRRLWLRRQESGGIEMTSSSV
jgi:hypothetical protein